MKLSSMVPRSRDLAPALVLCQALMVRKARLAWAQEQDAGARQESDHAGRRQPAERHELSRIACHRLTRRLAWDTDCGSTLFLDHRLRPEHRAWSHWLRMLRSLSIEEFDRPIERSDRELPKITPSTNRRY